MRKSREYKSISAEEVIGDKPLSDLEREKIVTAYIMGAEKYGDRSVKYSKLMGDLKLSYGQTLALVRRVSKKFGQEVHTSMVTEFALDVIKDGVAELQYNQQMQTGIIQTIAGTMQEILLLPDKVSPPKHKLDIVLTGLKELPALQGRATESITAVAGILGAYCEMSGIKSLPTVIQQTETNIDINVSAIGDKVDAAIREKFQNAIVVREGDSSQAGGVPELEE